MLRRLVTLILSWQKSCQTKVLKRQAENINQAAKKFMERNERLKRVFKFFLKKTGVNVFEKINSQEIGIFSDSKSIFYIL